MKTAAEVLRSNFSTLKALLTPDNYNLVLAAMEEYRGQQGEDKWISVGEIDSFLSYAASRGYTYDTDRMWRNGKIVTGETNTESLLKEFKALPTPPKGVEQKEGLREKDHLLWIYNRLVNVHGESENYDYMLKFKEIIDFHL